MCTKKISRTDGTSRRNHKNQGSLTIEYHFKYTSGHDNEISEQRIKEIEDKKQEIDHKYGTDLVTFFKEHCEKGADVALKLADILQKFKLI
jgi:hypothetical protein